MKKIDKLVLGSFLGPFFITFLVVVFILLNINMLKYFDDIVGKDLGWGVVGQLFFYFAIFTIPTAMPLAVLLSSLIAFGNLGEHFELTAIKSAGVSLVRVLRPILFFVILLTVFAFLANNYLVPKAALEAYSLLYDIKQKKPALELQEGAFYDGIPGISIKVNKKFPDGKTFNDVVIYDHRKNDGNKEVIVADSGKMYTILNEQYLKLELFNGYNYTEGSGKEREMTGQRTTGGKESLTRSKFDKTQAVFDLASFTMKQTDKKWFQGNRIMRNLTELTFDMDSLHREILKQRLSHYQFRRTFFNFYGRKDSLKLPPEVLRYQENRDSFYIRKYATPPSLIVDSTEKKVDTNKVVNDSAVVTSDSVKVEKPIVAPLKERRGRSNRTFAKRPSSIRNEKKKDLSKPKVSQPAAATTLSPIVTKQLTEAEFNAKVDSLLAKAPDRSNVQGAINMARQVKSQTENISKQIDNYGTELRIYAIQWHYIIASSLACIVMFLIGAPLGAIIKKGGLGMPFLVSILFFIIYYVLTMQGQKLAKQESFNVAACIYAADFLLFMAGLFFLNQARVDARLFESDAYAVALDKFKKWRKGRKKPVINPAV